MSSGYTDIIGGFRRGTATLIDEMGWRANMTDLEAIDPTRIASGQLTFVESEERLYRAIKIDDFTVEWKPVVDVMKYETLMSLTAGNYVEITEDTHKCGTEPIVSVKEVIDDGAIKKYYDVELDIYTDEDGSVFIKSNNYIDKLRITIRKIDG